MKLLGIVLSIVALFSIVNIVDNVYLYGAIFLVVGLIVVGIFMSQEKKSPQGIKRRYIRDTKYELAKVVKNSTSTLCLYICTTRCQSRCNHSFQLKELFRALQIPAKTLPYTGTGAVFELQIPSLYYWKKETTGGYKLNLFIDQAKSVTLLEWQQGCLMIYDCNISQLAKSMQTQTAQGK